ncbi:MAG: nucleoside transporter C-terminal domain-containing protein [Myxococcota bacterium]
MSGLGLLVMIGLAWLLSSRKRHFPVRIVTWGVGLQIAFGLLILKTSAGRAVFSGMNDAVVRLLEFTEAGSRFIFGPYLDMEFSIALHVLPTIIFCSSLMSVLYHLGLIQQVVRAVAYVMQRSLRTSGPETLSASANIFVGQTEAPLVIQPYVQKMSDSELMSVMVGGFATVAGGVLAAYVGMLHEHFPDIAGHLIASSVMSAPAALVMAKVMLPEVVEPSSKPKEAQTLLVRPDTVNVVDAAAKGAADGLSLALNVGAMLLGFLALVALVNFLIGLPVEAYASVTGDATLEPITLQRILGYAFAPMGFLMGAPPEDCMRIGTLLGQKMVLTEFVAFVELAEILAAPDPEISPRGALIATYALCGFANFGSIAIQIGGIGTIAPSRRADLARLGPRAMLGGSLATCMTACVAGMVI